MIVRLLEKREGLTAAECFSTAVTEISEEGADGEEAAFMAEESFSSLMHDGFTYLSGTGLVYLTHYRELPSRHRMRSIINSPLSASASASEQLRWADECGSRDRQQEEEAS